MRHSDYQATNNEYLNHDMNPFSDLEIISSWLKNANQWVTAVRNGEIESRLLVTNAAIIKTVLDKSPKNVLDIGCGEGWLTRKLVHSGINCLGVDVVPELIDAAQKAGHGRFRLLTYEDVSLTTLIEKFDVIVCNFSLLGNESVLHLFQQIPSILNNDGCLIVQTLHPVVSCGDTHYEDGWREGSWDGFNEEFSDPAPWYFRTMASWQTLFTDNNFHLSNIQEPQNPKTGQPASVIFTGEILAQVD